MIKKFLSVLLILGLFISQTPDLIIRAEGDDVILDQPEESQTETVNLEEIPMEESIEVSVIEEVTEEKEELPAVKEVVPKTEISEETETTETETTESEAMETEIFSEEEEIVSEPELTEEKAMLMRAAAPLPSRSSARVYLSATAGGMISWSCGDTSSGTVNEEETIELSDIPAASTINLQALPSEDNTFVGWYQGEELVCENAEYVYELPTELSETLTAVFQPVQRERSRSVNNQTYRITLSGNGNNDIYPLNRTPEGYYKWDGYSEGEPVEMHIGPAFGYRLDSYDIKRTDNNTSIITPGQKSFTMPASDVVVEYTATYTEIIGFRMGYIGAGSITYTETDSEGYTRGGSGISNFSITKGNKISFTATPAQGYQFAGWFKGVIQTDSSKDLYGFVYDYTEPYYSGESTYSFIAGAEGTPVLLCAVFMKIPEISEITNVTLNFTLPASGQKASDIRPLDLTSLSEDSHSSFLSGSWYDTDPTSGSPQPFTGTFVEGNTYYAKIVVQPDAAYKYLQGGEHGSGSSPTALTVTGASQSGQYLVVYNILDEYGYMQYGVAYFSFKPRAVNDYYFDQTIDNSVSYVNGTVKITGRGGTQAGYHEGETVYSEQISVIYSNPKPAEVENMISAANVEVTAISGPIVENGKNGNLTISQSESTGKVWDKRKYASYQYDRTMSNGDNETVTVYFVNDTGTFTIVVPLSEMTKFKTGDRAHVASGDYGKETFYTVAAEGYVDGYDITVVNDGNGTASSNLTASLAGKTVTLSASANSGYDFDHWEVIAGDADLANPTSASTTFIMPKADVEMKACFKTQHEHDWDEPSYTWSDDYATVTAKRICKTDPSHIETENVFTQSTVVKAASCSETGVTRYTASFSNPAFTEQNKEVETAIDQDAHEWGEWVVTKEPTVSEEGTETRICNHNPEHSEERSIAKITYSKISGDGSTYTNGSGSTLTFIFKRSYKDEETIDRFSGVKVGSTEIRENDDYSKKSGSVEVTLKNSYLESLSVGEYQLTAVFKDGIDGAEVSEVTVKFSVKEKSSEKDSDTSKKDDAQKTKVELPKTGIDRPANRNNIPYEALILLVQFAALILLIRKAITR